MKALLLREIKSFLVADWIFSHRDFSFTQRIISFGFEGEFNILNSGFADMSPFFKLAPWILIFLIPAVTMRSFSDEKNMKQLSYCLPNRFRIGTS